MMTQRDAEDRSGMAERLFLEHPRSLGMSWAGHGAGAVAIGARLVGAGLACMIHALVPGVFTQTAGKTITGYRVSRDGTDTGNTGAYSTVVTAATRTSSMRFLLVGATYSLSVQALLSDGSVAPVARGSVRIH